ncbi:MAG: ATP-dependent helicase HrpB [Myxococcota bacterium]
MSAPGAGRAPELPVAGVLDDVVGALSRAGRVVLRAPPGSGKTTLVPPAILESGLAGDGEIVLLQPRRVAARTVARHLARGFGENSGGVVGHQVRFDTKVSDRTRIRVVTEGVLTARLQGDPTLEGVSAVILDEFHERSLDADLALALVREVQEALREDLKLIIMSATLDAAPIARYLGDCPVVETRGRQHPVDIRWLDRPDERPVGARVAAGVRRLVGWMDAGEVPAGDVLAFLPGVRDIERAGDLLRGRLDREILPLHGSLPPAAQDRALVPGARLRVVLATNIAETSLTIEGVAGVVDSGLAKVVRYDPAVGADRLETTRVSRASADQRAGRAGRLGPGTALRLWTGIDHSTRPAFDEPEIRRVDLAALVLDLRAWGVVDPSSFGFFEPPPGEALARAEALLAGLGAVEGEGAPITDRGRAMRRVPAHPRVARVLLDAADQGEAEVMAWVGALLEDPRLVRRRAEGRVGAADVLLRLERLRADPSIRGGRRVALAARQLARAAGGRVDRRPPDAWDEDAVCRLLLGGWADRLGRRVSRSGRELVMVGGRGALLARESVVQNDPLLLALDVDAGRRGAHARSLVRSASRVDPEWLEAHPDLVEEDRITWDEGRERVLASRVRRFRDLVLEETPIPLDDRDTAAEVLAEAAAKDPQRALDPDERARALLRRMALLAEAMPEPGLPEDPWSWVRELLPELCHGLSSFEDLRRLPLARRLEERLPWTWRQALDEHAPTRFRVPSGSRIRIDYPAEGPPVLAVKVQEVFGWTATPAIAGGRVPLVLHLLNPAGRPLQVTRDLESFWRRTWPEVRKEMRSRYPKHRWPEDPMAAQPSRRTTRPRR